MRIAYTVPGAGASTAFTPIPAITGAVLNYKGGVVGQPGTLGIPSPRPDVPNNNDIVAYPFAGGYSNSGSMPDVWYPNLYYQASLDIPGEDVEAGNIQVWSDNQMPIPARDPRGRAAVLAGAPKFLGQSQIQARKAIPRWPNWLPRPGYGQ
jgi:hypothetical protein